jgi:phosphate:Na+ symporter
MLIQSSSAMMAITLTALHSGSIDFIHAAGIIIGSELGTTVKVLLGSLSGSTDKKRVAFGNFYFNLYTILMATVLLYPFTHLLTDVLYLSDSLIALVIFQSSINVIAILCFFPFIDRYSEWIQRRIQSDESESPTLYLHKVNVEETDAAIEAIYNEFYNLFNQIIEHHRAVFGITTNEKQLSLFQSFRGKNNDDLDLRYEKLKLLNGEIFKFSADAATHALMPEASSRLLEAVDIAKNLLRAAKNI